MYNRRATRVRVMHVLCADRVFSVKTSHGRWSATQYTIRALNRSVKFFTDLHSDDLGASTIKNGSRLNNSDFEIAPCNYLGSNCE